MTEPPDEPSALVYVPCAEHVLTPAEAVPLALRTEDGRLVLLAYSTVDRLRAGWGEEQPWLAWPTEALDALLRAQEFDRAVVDPEQAPPDR